MATPKTESWADELRDVLAGARALAENMRKVREALPPGQSGMALRLEDFEQTLHRLLEDEVLQRLLAEK
jgi:hypothetical protein